MEASAIEQLRQMSHSGSAWDPLLDAFFFLAASLLIIWRLEAISARGVEGTILGTLFMPYFSGLGNLIFVYILLKSEGPGEEVMINCLINNATNITLIIGLCGVIWPLSLLRKATNRKLDQTARLHRLSLLFTMLAMLFFCGITWSLAGDGVLDRGDGWTLVGLFLFWQAIHVFEVLKENVRRGSSWHPMIIFDVLIILVASIVLYLSTEWLVDWIMSAQSGFISADHLGLITGWLMVLPNAVVAVYYAWRSRADVVYASQFGDAHICIPLCLGLYAAFQDMPMPAGADAALIFIAGVCALNLLTIGLFSKLHRITAGVLIFCYALFYLIRLG